MASQRRDSRSQEAKEYRHLYATTRWRKLRLQHLNDNPLCVMCLPRVVPATVVDHVHEHKGNIEAFYNGPFQSLCATHHSATKQRIERGAGNTAIGADGWPIES